MVTTAAAASRSPSLDLGPRDGHAAATHPSSAPITRNISPSPSSSSTPHRLSTPPPPPSSAVPTDFRSSLSAWWSNTSYKDARIAEERLLRRMAHFRAAPAPLPNGALPSEGGKNGGSGAAGWAFWSSAEKAHAEKGEVQEVTPPAALTEEQGGLVATLRNVFIPTPDPTLAPAHPADPIEVEAEAGTAASSPAASIASTGESSKCKKRTSMLKRGKDEGKFVDYINTLEISKPEDKDSKEAVVVLHGYAAALGFFFRNWDPIAQHTASTHRRTFFLDWLGMGLSSRPSPSLLSVPGTPAANSAAAALPSSPTPARVATAEHFFLSSLEAWREAVGIERMVLVGHSLGGYLASAYAVRYPHRVSSLVLVSPAGIPHGPEYTRYPLTSELRAAAGGQAGTGGGAGHEAATSPLGEAGLDEAVDAAEQELGPGQGQGKFEAKGEAKQWKDGREQSMFRRNAMKFFVWGWERGISPFTFLRSMGPWGPMFAGRYSLRRFGKQSEEDVRDLHNYIYNTSVLKGSGEFCISHILAPGAYARVPIVDRIDRLKVPVTFIFGDNDWMDVQGGHDSVAALEKAGNAQGRVHVVKDAGHHVYLDNPEDTNRIIGEAIRAAK